jgi:hypothetical protein
MDFLVFCFLFFSVLLINLHRVSCACDLNSLLPASNAHIHPLTGLVHSSDSFSSSTQYNRSQYVEDNTDSSVPSNCSLISQFNSLASAQINPSCILLNPLSALSSLRCNFSSNLLVLSFINETSALVAYNSWINHGHPLQFINGGNCLNEKNELTIINSPIVEKSFILAGSFISVTLAPAQPQSSHEFGLFCFTDLQLNLSIAHDTAYLRSKGLSNSKSFQLFSSSSLTPTFLPYGSILHEGEELSLTWDYNPADFSSSSHSVYITLHKDVSAAVDTTYNSVSCAVADNSGNCKFVVPPVLSGSLEPFYFTFNWGSSSDSSCTTDCIQTDRWNIALDSTFSYNYNPTNGRAIKSIPIYSSNCTDYCADSKSNALFSEACALCKAGQRLSVDLLCSNCYYDFQFSFTQFNLIKSGQDLGLFDMKFVGFAELAMFLTIAAKYKLEFSATFPLLNAIPLPFLSSSFSILGVQLDLITKLGIDLEPTISVKSIESSLTAGAYYNASINIAVHYDLNSDLTATGAAELQQIYKPLIVDLQAEVMLDVVLRPIVEVSVAKFATARVSSDFYLTLIGDFSYPPWNPIASYYEADAAQPALFHWSWPADACQSLHLMQYHVQSGIRATGIYAHLLIRVLGLTAFEAGPYSFYPQALQLGPYELLSGCLFSLSPQYNTQITYTKQITYPINHHFDINSEHFQVGLLIDLATALQVSASRFRLIQSIYTEANNILVTLDIFPSLSSENQGNDYSVEALLELLNQQRNNPQSALYAQPFTQYSTPTPNNSTNETPVILAVIFTLLAIILITAAACYYTKKYHANTYQRYSTMLSRVLCCKKAVHFNAEITPSSIVPTGAKASVTQLASRYELAEVSGAAIGNQKRPAVVIHLPRGSVKDIVTDINQANQPKKESSEQRGSMKASMKRSSAIVNHPRASLLQSPIHEIANSPINNNHGITAHSSSNNRTESAAQDQSKRGSMISLANMRMAKNDPSSNRASLIALNKNNSAITSPPIIPARPSIIAMNKIKLTSISQNCSVSPPVSPNRPSSVSHLINKFQPSS